MREDGGLPPESAPAPEMSRPFQVSRIGNGTRVMVEARPEERRMLATRMGVLGIHSLTCRFDLRPDISGSIAAIGLLRVRVRQTCVVSTEAFDADLVESFSIRFVPGGTESEDLDLESDDEVAYRNGLLDLGEAASEQLALSLDPFPRMPGAELPGQPPAADSGAFSALGKLLPRN